jgi:hypothetical protein
MLYSRYPSTEYKISSFDKIIKDENSSNKPKTYKVTINMRNPRQQLEFHNKSYSNRNNLSEIQYSKISFKTYKKTC